MSDPRPTGRQEKVWKELLPVMVSLAEKCGLENEESFYARGSARARVEGALHELCHAVVLRLHPIVDASEIVRKRLHAMTSWRSDIQELETIACEVVVADALGIRLPRHVMMGYAFLGMRSLRGDEDLDFAKERVLEMQEMPKIRAMAERTLRLIAAEKFLLTKRQDSGKLSSS